MAHGCDGLTICQAAVAVAAAAACDEPKPMASEARPLRKHHVRCAQCRLGNVGC